MLHLHCVVESSASTQSSEMGCSSVRHANRQPHPRTTSLHSQTETRSLLHTQDTMAEIIYSELRPERQEIRLMFLEAGQPKDEIIASLMVTSLRWAPEYWTPEFEALSYVWGDPLVTRPIKLNGQPYQVTENLEAALRRLRHDDRVRIMWIDAICIDQQNPREQEHQIGLMRDIFGGCAQCIVWLGEEDHETEKVLESLHWMQDNLHVHEWPCFSNSKATKTRLGAGKDNIYGVGPVFELLQRFLRRPWFSRTWTFQEFVLPRKREIRCGHFQIPFSLLRKARQKFCLHTSKCCKMHSASLLSLINVLNDELDISIFPLDDMLDYHHNYKTIDFLKVLNDNCHRTATRDHDKIYGLIGLAPPYIQKAVLPDYRLDVAAVFAQPLVAHWQTKASLRPLIYVRKQSYKFQLPSWVPDWSHASTSRASQVLRTATYDIFNACRYKHRLPTVYNDKILHVQGVCSGTVKTLCEAKSMIHYKSGLFVTVSGWAEMAAKCSVQKSCRALGTFSINTLWRILLLGSVVGNGLLRRATESDFNSLHTELASFESDSQSTDPDRVSLLMKNVLYRLSRARLIMTTNGWLGMVPRDTQIGDEIYVLAGGRMPFVLRPSQETFSPPGSSNAQRFCHTLVGECYIDGSMDGELLDKLRDEVVDIFIV